MSRGRTERRKALNAVRSATARVQWLARWWDPPPEKLRLLLDAEHAAVEHAREVWRRWPRGGHLTRQRYVRGVRGEGDADRPPDAMG